MSITNITDIVDFKRSEERAENLADNLRELVFPALQEMSVPEIVGLLENTKLELQMYCMMTPEED
jgi:hypothetical protein